MAIKTLADFIADSEQKDASQEVFELESSHLLEVKLAGRVWAKAGSMVAYRGSVNFVRQGMMEQGLGNLLKKAVSGEGMQLMKMEGNGRVYVADAGKKITLLRLAGESIFVNGNDVLAFEDGIASEITMMKRMAGMLSGGLFNMKLTGSGVVAITSHYEPLTLRVRSRAARCSPIPMRPVAWSGACRRRIVTNISLGSLLGRGSGESIQLKFAGEGWVVVQPTKRSTCSALAEHGMEDLLSGLARDLRRAGWCCRGRRSDGANTGGAGRFSAILRFANTFRRCVALDEGAWLFGSDSFLQADEEAFAWNFLEQEKSRCLRRTEMSNGPPKYARSGMSTCRSRFPAAAITRTWAIDRPWSRVGGRRARPGSRDAGRRFLRGLRAARCRPRREMGCVRWAQARVPARDRLGRHCRTVALPAKLRHAALNTVGRHAGHASLKYRPEIDGLRALAVVRRPGVPPPRRQCRRRVPGGGFLGVDVFFVISGFLITSVILGDANGASGFSLARFYEKRARRLLSGASARVAGRVATRMAVADAATVGAVRAVGARCARFRVELLLVGDTTGIRRGVLDLVPLAAHLVARRGGAVLPLVSVRAAAGPADAGHACFGHCCWQRRCSAWWRRRHSRKAVRRGCSTCCPSGCGNWRWAPGWRAGRQRELTPAQGWQRALPVVGLLLIVSAMAVPALHSAYPGAKTLLPVCGTLLVLRWAGNDPATRMLGSRPSSASD
jgi:uncharacterized protein (AIM24 family)